MENNKLILEVKNLKKYFPLKKSILGKPLVELKAVDDVSFKLEAGKTIGVVGESGCGKTTLGRTILQLYDTTGGKSLYYGHSIEEFLPKYYINEIHKLTKYANKFKSLRNKLFNLINNNEELKFLNNEVGYVTISDYNNGLKIVEEEIKKLENEENKELIAIKDIINSILNVLNDSSCCSGGYLLGNANECKQLLLNKIYTKNKIIKNNDENKINDLDEQLNFINNELESVNKQLNDLPLFKELQEKVETGLDLAKLSKEELRSLRTEIQLIFQDPYSSLPPRMTIGSILSEPVKVHKIVEKDKISEHVHKVMKMCGLQPQYYDRYPHEFSGGQRQRICIARALSVNPKLVICDEPVSALDVSIQAQIINLLKQLQNELGLTYMFISHDLSVVKYITDSIIVMYLGNMMEIGNTKDIFQNPLHPYTQALFSAVPVPDPDAKMNRIILKGDIPSPANPPKGCKFHTRCGKCMNVCKIKTPEFIQYDENHLVACHLYDKEVMNNLEKYDKLVLESEQKEEQNNE